jgi:hypothetical protein
LSVAGFFAKPPSIDNSSFVVDGFFFQSSFRSEMKK